MAKNHTLEKNPMKRIPGLQAENYWTSLLKFYNILLKSSLK